MVRQLAAIAAFLFVWSSVATATVTPVQKLSITNGGWFNAVDDLSNATGSFVICDAWIGHAVARSRGYERLRVKVLSTWSTGCVYDGDWVCTPASYLNEVHVGLIKMEGGALPFEFGLGEIQVPTYGNWVEFEPGDYATPPSGYNYYYWRWYIRPPEGGCVLLDLQKESGYTTDYWYPTW